MSKKSCFRWPIDIQHGKRAETLIHSTPAPLPYSLIIVKEIALEKVTRSDMQSIQSLC